MRVCTFDGDLNARLPVKIKHSPSAARDGSVEFDAGELLTRVETAIESSVAKANRPIEAVASCAFWHSIVGVDDRGRPTTSVMTWADRRSREYSQILKERFDEAEIHVRTGAHFHSSFWPAKLLWFRRERPEIFAKTSRWLSFSDLVALRFFGESITSVSMASATGIFDQRKCTWDAELLKYLKVRREQLPRITGDGETLRLTARYARRWPQLKEAQWFPAIGDGAADNIGSDCVTKNKAALMVGTSAAMRVAYTGSPPKQIPKGLWCYRIDRKRVIIGGALSDGGNLYAYIKSQFGLRGDLDQRLRSRTAADDLVVIPFFYGERSTGYDENACGAIIGLTAGHDGIDVLRAAMEGVAFRISAIHDRLKKIARIDEIIASGGALRDSPVWTEMIADVLGCKLTGNLAIEPSMRGSVLLAYESLGKM